ncbi:MAG TPA: hypothetical protein VK465_08665 [Fibrobacteria bacterium]|nr:hypothetical protein [Fibrobacteria bacterium]
MRELRQSTAVTVKVGPLTDSAGDPLTTLTIQKADLRLTKNGGNLAAASADQGSADAGAPHDELGIYDCSLDTTDTNTLGHLRVAVRETGQIVAWEDFNVVDPEYWDAKYSTGLLPVNVTQISDDATAANNAESFFDGTGYAGTNNVIPTVTTLTGHTAQTGDAFARLGAPAGASVSADIAAVKTDTGNLVTRITATLFSGITRFSHWLGALAGKQAADATALTEIRASGSGSGTYDPTTDSLEAIRDAGASAAAIADAVWDEATSGHSTAGTTGKALIDAGSAGDPWATALPGAYGAGTAGKILGDNLNATVSSRATQTSVDDVPTVAEMNARTLVAADYATAASQTTMDGKLNAIDDYIDTEIAALTTNLATVDAVVDSILALLQDGTVGLAAIESLVDELETRLTAVRAGYMDNLSAGAVALDSTVAKEATLASTGRGDPSALAGALGGSLTPLAKVDWIFAKLMRAKSFDKTTGVVLVKNSAGTDIAKSTAADDGTTTSEGAYGAP